MPEVLSENDAFASDVSVPIGGDRRRAASIRPAFQALANRTHFFRRWQERVDPRRIGALRVRRFADLAELRAAQDMVDGEMCLVRFPRTGFSPYVFDAAATDSADDLLCVSPASSSGRWFSVVGSLIDTGYNERHRAMRSPHQVLPRLDSRNAMLDPRVIPNAILGIFHESIVDPHAEPLGPASTWDPSLSPPQRVITAPYDDICLLEFGRSFHEDELVAFDGWVDVAANAADCIVALEYGSFPTGQVLTIARGQRVKHAFTFTAPGRYSGTSAALRVRIKKNTASDPGNLSIYTGSHLRAIAYMT